MSKPDLPDGSRWAKLSPQSDAWREEHPYRECPNCGRFRFRWQFRYGGILSGEHGFEECKECKYRGEELDE